MDPAQWGPVSLLVAGIGALFAAFVRGDIVPGWIYKAAIKRAEKAEAVADRAVGLAEDMARKQPGDHPRG